MSEQVFGQGFLWGTATSCYQVEGALDEDGRGVSIWDTFCRTGGNIKCGHTAEAACDQYHRYQEDVGLMSRIGLKAYRFSIAWPRVFPDGQGQPNPKGFDYYHRLIDALLAAGIQPVATLFHWDLPQKLQDQGGWPERQTAYRFAEYAAECFSELGDKAKLWLTLNEPYCAAFLGYGSGIHAPGLKDAKLAYRATHHLNLAHGLAVRAFRQAATDGQIGIAANPTCVRPATDRAEDALAADRNRDLATRMFLNPMFGRSYPQRHLDAVGATVPVESGDMEQINQRVDFLGLNYYQEVPVEYAPDRPEQFAGVPSHHPRTDYDWAVTPGGLCRLLEQIDSEYGPIPLYVTENGCSCADVLTPDGNSCHDTQRIEYMRSHLASLARAIRKGLDVRGYLHWSFIDNFEWAEGYTKRFGLVYCDYASQRRIPKDSFYYYREVIAGHEEF